MTEQQLIEETRVGMTNMFGPIFTIEPRTSLACDARLKMDFGTVLASHYIHGGWSAQLLHHAAYEGETLQIAVDKLKAHLVKDTNNLLSVLEMLNVRPDQHGPAADAF